MLIVKKVEKENQIDIGDLVVEPESDVACWVCEKMSDNEFPYPLISIQTGKVVDWYNNMGSINKYCTLLAKNKYITLTY